MCIRDSSWIAAVGGVTDKRIRYILDGERTVKGETTPIQMTYTEQFCLLYTSDAADEGLGVDLGGRRIIKKKKKKKKKKRDNRD
uniref:Uncharacterized protein n=1 Tax=Ralstonia solanacearum TaxID=305 RepID=A0A0S4WPN2_RALSL|nr:protein of unknown function [Ralstonia solanacearum]